SGDHSGNSSRAPGVPVKLRVSPFLPGTVNTSPRAPNSALAPDGDNPKELTNLSTLMNSGRDHDISLSTASGVSATFSDLKSSEYSRPPFSYTIAGDWPPPRLGHFTSYSL